MLRQTTRGGAARASEGWSAASRRPGRHRRERSRLPTAVCALLLVAGIALIGSLVSVDRTPAASSCGAGLPAYFYPFAVRSNETRWSRQSGSNGRASEPK